jgi:CO/xanthine dehydrogenase Mo-binding subunit
MAYIHIGKDFTPPDVQAKVTGKAKYAEDFRADGMVFCRLLLSPMPHARVTNIDASEALKIPGVIAVLTADELPETPEPRDPALTNEPHFAGQPILAVAAESEALAQDAIDKIKLDLEELPFTVDPLQSLYPGGPNARLKGNTISGGFGQPPEVKSVKWNARDFADAGDDKLPMGEVSSSWDYGDIDAGFAKADLILDESFVTNSNPTHSLEPRSAMAYWQNGKCFLYGSSQSQSMVKPAVARAIGIESKDLVYIAEYCGGGFGSKIVTYPVMSIPPLMSKKIGRPVMMRISRAEEYFLGSARPGFQGRIKMGFTKEGRITAADLFIVLENGPYSGSSEHGAAADGVSVLYQPEAMRYRGISVSTNTTPKGAQRGPGQNQIVEGIDPVISKAARQLGIDQLEIRKLNAANNDSKYGGRQTGFSSAYQKEALEKGAAKFNWADKSKQSGNRQGSKVIGVGIGQAFHPAGFSGMDGMVRITPDGILHIHSGVGNLGTYSHSGTSRIAAEILKCDWEHCIIERGDSRKHLPWNMAQGGSNTSNTMTRTNYVAAMDAIAKLKEIAATDLGGNPDDYDIGDEKVFAKADPAKSLTYAQAAQRAIELGGKFSGQEVPEDINGETKEAVTGIAGTGLIGVAKDNLERTGTPAGLGVAFMRIELDTETGQFDILDYVGVADCGTVIHPMGLATQIKGGAVMGIGMASLEKTVYDPQNGLPANVGLYQAKPPSFLDVPKNMDYDAVDLPDKDNPLGIKGMGEPPMGAGASCLLSAISDALGGHYFNRAPVTRDMIINVASGQPDLYKHMRINTQ